MWVADPCNGIPAIRADGRCQVLYEESENRSCSGSETKGWMIGDEVDMCCGPPGFAGGNGYTMLTSRNTSLPIDGKMRYTNFGKGVLWWEDAASAAQFVNLPFLGLVSADAYWMTDPNELGNPKYGMPSSYGWNVDRLRQIEALLEIELVGIETEITTRRAAIDSAALGTVSMSEGTLRTCLDERRNRLK